MPRPSSASVVEREGKGSRAPGSRPEDYDDVVEANRTRRVPGLGDLQSVIAHEITSPKDATGGHIERVDLSVNSDRNEPVVRE